jgi:cell division protein FtsA
VGGVGGGNDGVNTRGLYEFGRPRQITEDDMAYAIDRTARVRLEDDRCLLHVFPQDFTLDGRSGFRFPRGSTCSRLEANVHIVTAPAQEHDCLINAIHQAHFAVEETIFEAVAAAYASVMKDDRNRGVAIVDIGSYSTGIAVYDGEAILLARSIAVSADHFTRDVAFGLKVQYEDAERLKVEYGCAILGLTSDNSLIEVPSAEGRSPREAPRRQLNEILEARAEELFCYVGAELARIGMDQKLLEGIVLTGGGALLNGMCDMAERVLNCPARNGLPAGIDAWPDALDSPAWTTAAGLAMYSARLKNKRDPKRRAPGLAGLVLR